MNKEALCAEEICSACEDAVGAGNGLRVAENKVLMRPENNKVVQQDDGQEQDVQGSNSQGQAVAGADRGDAEVRALAQHNALAAVFDQVRTQSRDSSLTQPGHWEEAGLVPDHLNSEEFEMMVYEYLEEYQAATPEEQSISTHRSATRTVGVPRMFGNAHSGEAENTLLVKQSDSEVAASTNEVSADAAAKTDSPVPSIDQAVSVAPDANQLKPDSSAPESQAPESQAPESQNGSSSLPEPYSHLTLPEGYKLVQMEGEYVMVPDQDAPVKEKPIDCSHIKALVGAHSYYLYSDEIMGDAYAHWAFLAAEDDKVVAFVDCVREDSRVYPRPLAALNLCNPPFCFSEAEIQEAWDKVRKSCAYPDIQRTQASNNEIYYFSTNYLSPEYAASLAEWDAVERKMYL